MTANARLAAEFKESADWNHRCCRESSPRIHFQARPRCQSTREDGAISFAQFVRELQQRPSFLQKWLSKRSFRSQSFDLSPGVESEIEASLMNARKKWKDRYKNSVGLGRLFARAQIASIEKQLRALKEALGGTTINNYVSFLGRDLFGNHWFQTVMSYALKIVPSSLRTTKLVGSLALIAAAIFHGQRWVIERTDPTRDTGAPINAVVAVPRGSEKNKPYEEILQRYFEKDPSQRDDNLLRAELKKLGEDPFLGRIKRGV